MTGYKAQDNYAICWGRPLCDDSQLLEVIKAFTRYLHDKKLKPVFACVDLATQKVVGEQLHWSCLIAAAEQRIDPRKVNLETADKQVRTKINRAEREGVKVHTVDAAIPDDIIQKINIKMKEWKKNRSGSKFQVFVG